MWAGHSDHGKVQQWFRRNAASGWATCPATQIAFIRIVSNPAFSAHAVTPSEALQTLAATLQHRDHEFWPDSIDATQALGPVRNRLVGHRQVPDAYLLGLALHKKGKLATLDRGIWSLVSGSPEISSAVVLI
jgi:toxin-antitoxin system PIN domain toxin